MLFSIGNSSAPTSLVPSRVGAFDVTELGFIQGEPDICLHYQTLKVVEFDVVTVQLRFLFSTTVTK